MNKKRDTNRRKYCYAIIIVAIAAALLVLCFNIPQANYAEGQVDATSNNDIIAAAGPNPDIVETGHWVFEESINHDGDFYTFGGTLEERTRLLIEGEFDKPVSFLLLTEPYYSAYLQERQVKTNAAYVRDRESFSQRIDINEGEGGTYHFIVFAHENGFDGKIKIFEIAKL